VFEGYLNKINEELSLIKILEDSDAQSKTLEKVKNHCKLPEILDEDYIQSESPNDFLSN
jgi:hypothetical protein